MSLAAKMLAFSFQLTS